MRRVSLTTLVLYPLAVTMVSSLIFSTRTSADVPSEKVIVKAVVPVVPVRLLTLHARVSSRTFAVPLWQVTFAMLRELAVHALEVAKGEYCRAPGFGAGRALSQKSVHSSARVAAIKAFSD